MGGQVASAGFEAFPQSVLEYCFCIPGCRKKERDNFFSVQSIYIEYTFCKQNGEKTLNLSAAVTKVNCLPVYDVITAN